MSSSLVDEFLQDSSNDDNSVDHQQKNESHKNQQLPQKVSKNNVKRQASALIQKQSLHDLKKKYNFYDDSSSSNSCDDDDENQQEDDFAQYENEKKQSSREQHHYNCDNSKNMDISQDSEDKKVADLQTLSQFLRSEANLQENNDDESIENYSKLEESKVQDDEKSELRSSLFDQIDNKLDKILQKNKNQRSIDEQYDDEKLFDQAEEDLYQLSEGGAGTVTDGQLSSIENRLSSIKKGIKLRGSIVQQASELVLDSEQRDNNKIDIIGYQNTQLQMQSELRSQTELTFGDLASNESEIIVSELKHSRDSNAQVLSQSQGYKRKPLLPQSNNSGKGNSIIKEELYEDVSQSSPSLEYSQGTLQQSTVAQGFNATGSRLQRLQNQLMINSQIKQEMLPPPIPTSDQIKSLKRIITNIRQKSQSQALHSWRERSIKDFYQTKLDNAAQMVQKMSKFSRSFIALNSLSAIIQKNRLRIQGKMFHKWAKKSSPQRIVEKSNDQSEKKILELERKLSQKDEEIRKMEHMFQEYSNWRTKLEQIENKMRGEIDFWKTSCDKIQKENDKLQREILKQGQQLQDKIKEIETKNLTIDRLKKEAQLYTVEEQVCSNCRNSLEESQMLTSRSNHRQSHHQESVSSENENHLVLIRDLSDKLSTVESQLSTYRERLAYHQSMEEELKRNLESQVDVVLKMEEERLLLLKENKEFKEKNRSLTLDNEEYQSKIEIFEKELEELQVQIRQEKEERMKNQHSNEDQISESESSTKENKSQNVTLKKKTTLSSQKSGVKNFKKATSTLKFQPSISKAAPVDTSAISTSIQSQPIITSSIDKSLVVDNQILTNELVTLNREVQKLRSEHRLMSEQLKKSDKERNELKKSLEAKDQALEKLRKEKDELWAIVNTDKYRNIKQMETERDRAEKAKIEVEGRLEVLKVEIEKERQKVSELIKKLQESQYSQEKAHEREVAREKLLEVLEEKSRKIQKELELNEQLATNSKKESELLRNENAQLKKDVEWLANSAKNNKLQAERAITDLEAYTKILRGMEKKLAETEVERESKEVELRDLRQKIMIFEMQNKPPQPMQMMMNPIQMHSQGYPNMLQQQNHPMWNQQVNTMPAQVTSNMHGWMPQTRAGVPQPQQPPQRFQ